MKEKEPSPAKEETKKDGIRSRDKADKLEKINEEAVPDLKKKEKTLNESWRSWVKRASDWTFSWSLQEMIFIVVFAAVAIPVAIISAVHILPLVWRICVSAFSTSNWFIGKTIGNMWRPTKAESFAQGAKDVVAASAVAVKGLSKEVVEAAAAAGVTKGASVWAYIVGATTAVVGGGWGTRKVVKIIIKAIRMRF
jgi:hypothetical protein